MRAGALGLLLVVAACAASRAAPRTERPFVPWQGDRWIGRGIAYGPHRDGQRPGGPTPSRAQLREDLALLAPRFTLLRLYSSDAPAEALLSLVHEERLPFRILLGAWIAPETSPEAAAANAREVAGAVRLANAYPDLVLAVCVGNETQVSWSAHRLPAATLVGWLRRARAGTAVPVATADDFGFWLSPDAGPVAAEVDVIVAHVYAMWNGRPLEDALAFTQGKYAEIVRRFPRHPVVLGEAGWATRRHAEGDQATLIKGEAGEGPQRAFFEQFTAWVVRERITSTWFEAFDEGWKGGPHPDEIEKHWGLYRSDRTPKEAVRESR